MTSTTETLKALIKLSGLSRKDYAKRHNLEYNNLNGWLIEQRVIPIKRLQELAFEDGLKINVEYSIINL
jgi:transcriptional regulator with XRE-family HTH domain